MQNQNEYAGYSFDSEETFEWSTRHKILSIKNSLALLKEECASEAEVTEGSRFRDILITTAKILEALEQSFERDFDEDGITYTSKSNEPWD